MLKIFLTGDNHIGIKYAGHAQREILCSKRISAFKGMVERANNERCDLFVISGDLFENTYSISKSDVKEVLSYLADFDGTVVVLPGNHDCYDENAAVWKHFSDAVTPYHNIALLKDSTPVPFNCGEKEAVLYPAPCMKKQSEPGENNLGPIRALEIPSDGRYHIGVAHGALEGITIDNEGKYFLMGIDELEKIPVDAWLIGHTHVPYPRNLKENEYSECGKIFNSGTHVQTDVSCSTDGECFIIEIDKDKKVKAKNFVSGNICFIRETIEVTADSFERQVEEYLNKLDDDSCVEITLTGAVNAEEYENRDEILNTLGERFIEFECNTSAMSRLVTEDIINAEFAETSLAYGLLKSLVESDNKKAIQLAYEMLSGLKEEE